MAFGSVTLRQGSTGSDVRELQTKLNSLGYDCGKVDGIFGTKTLAAVKRFQQKYKLAVDGIVGKNTFKKLAEVLSKKKSSATSSGGSSSGSSSGTGGGTTTTKTETSSKTSTSTVTLTTGDKVSVAADELRVAIQTKGIVKTDTQSSTSKSSDKSGNTTSSTEVKTTTTTNTTMSHIYYPPIEGDVTWDTERSGSPGKVTFNVMGDVPITEGDLVTLTYGDKKVFVGYIFDRKIDKSGVISVTAYDQLKYWNNTDTYVFENIKASEVIKRIAKDYGMSIGTIEDTGVVIPSIVEDNQTLTDIAHNALDKTVAASKNVYVFYDDCGKLALKSLDSMRTNLLLCESTVGDYSFTSSIENDVYNQIVLYHEDSETKQRQYFTASSQNSIRQWGLLRKTEKLDQIRSKEDAQALANLYLAIYNKKVRKLSVSDAFGRPDIRAGTLVPVVMKVGDVNLRNYMLVEKASHTWSNGKYVMNLDLSGAGVFSV